MARDDAMAREFKLPDIGEGVAEGEVVKWLVREGQPIRENDLMVEVMTDKVTVQIPSPVTGKVLALRAKEGEVVKVGQTLLVLGEEGEIGPPPSAPPAETEEKLPPPPGPTVLPPPPLRASAPGPALATPAVRKLAREMGVDIERIVGTGSGGRITDEDVRRATMQPPTAAVAPPKPAVELESLAATPREERIPIRGLRHRIFEKMAKSHAMAAAYTYVEEVDVTQLVHLRDRLKEVAERKGLKLTYLPFFIKALIAALKEHPTLNAVVDDERGEVVVKRYYNIGIATATEEGLTVAVVLEADGRDLWGLSKEVERLATAAREKRLQLAEVQGSTFTITSLGAQGGVLATPVINWPEVAILGIHKIEKRPVVRNDQVVVREMMYLSCTFDHRVIDGHVGAAFVQTLVNFLEHPALLFVGIE